MSVKDCRKQLISLSWKEGPSQFSESMFYSKRKKKKKVVFSCSHAAQWPCDKHPVTWAPCSGGLFIDVASSLNCSRCLSQRHGDQQKSVCPVWFKWTKSPRQAHPPCQRKIMFKKGFSDLYQELAKTTVICFLHFFFEPVEEMNNLSPDNSSAWEIFNTTVADPT